jgi:SpoVK/Ycf46/Vps4 family AAA+-type ATPase
MSEPAQRRLQFWIPFLPPNSEERLRLLQSFIPPEAPLAPDFDLSQIARRIQGPVGGGSLKNIVYAAAFFAAGEGQPIAMEHLVRAAKRECFRDPTLQFQ